MCNKRSDVKELFNLRTTVLYFETQQCISLKRNEKDFLLKYFAFRVIDRHQVKQFSIINVYNTFKKLLPIKNYLALRSSK